MSFSFPAVCAERERGRRLTLTFRKQVEKFHVEQVLASQRSVRAAGNEVEHFAN